MESLYYLVEIISRKMLNIWIGYHKIVQILKKFFFLGNYDTEVSKCYCGWLKQLNDANKLLQLENVKVLSCLDFVDGDFCKKDIFSLVVQRMIPNRTLDELVGQLCGHMFLCGIKFHTLRCLSARCRNIVIKNNSRSIAIDVDIKMI